jgi:DNA-binding transcriptional MerR regulator
MPHSQKPTYNLKAVLDETGISPDTLRVWERRYGVPMPQRTPGGHRLYSERDVQMVKWLIARRAEGQPISRAVKHWNALIASGQDPLAEYVAQQHASLQAALAAVREAWLAACRDFNEAEAESALDGAFGIASVEMVATEVVLRGLREVGGGWHSGKITVQQEHFTSVLAMRCLHDLIAAAPRPNRPTTLILACPPAELHSLPLLYLNLMLRRRGWNAIFLGADVPLEHLEDAASKTRAALVVMGAQRLFTAVALRDAALFLAKRQVPVAYGGYVFNQLPELREQIAGDFLGESMESSVDCIEGLAEGKAAARQPRSTVSSFGAQAYRALRSEVEAALRKRLAGQVSPDMELDIANSYFGNSVAGALEFGNIAYVGANMDWINFLLTRPSLPFDSPRDYLQAYTAAVRQVMDRTGTEIADWLEAYAAGL